jgi:hypothetical protein
MTIEFRPGVQIYIADWLSRAYIEEKSTPAKPYQIFQMREENKLFKEIQNINQLSGQKIQKETQTDPVLMTLKTMVLSGWPKSRDEVPVSIREYVGFRDEITVHNGMYKGMNVIVPSSMHKQMLEKIHASHLGLEACLRRAKDVLYWHGSTSS